MNLTSFVYTSDLRHARWFRGTRGALQRVTKAIRDAAFNPFQQIIEFDIEERANTLPAIVVSKAEAAAEMMRMQA